MIVAPEDVILAAVAVGNPEDKPGLMPYGFLPENVKAQKSKTVLYNGICYDNLGVRYLLDLVDSDKNY